MQYFLRWSTQRNPLNEVYLLSKFDVISFSLTKVMYIFKLHFAYFQQLKVDTMLLTLAKSKLTLLVPISSLWTGDSYFTRLGQNRLQKTIQTHTVWWKIQESSIGSGTSAGIKNWVPQSISRLQKFCKTFFRLCMSKLVSPIFYQIFIFSPNNSPSKTVRNVFYFI